MLLTNVYVFVMDETFYMHETQNVEYSKKKIAVSPCRRLLPLAVMTFEKHIYSYIYNSIYTTSINVTVFLKASFTLYL